MELMDLFDSKKPLIGMIHLPPLPGYKTHPGMKQVIDKALTDLKTLEKAGFDGVLVENDSDQPHQIGVSKTITDAFTKVMKRILSEAKVPVGMEIIYDMPNTVNVAHKVGAQFVRIDVFVDNVVTRWGKIYAEADKIASLNKQSAHEIALFTDIQVKHAKMLDKKSLQTSAKEAIKNGSDALIVTGSWTGIAPDLRRCKTVRKAAGTFPVLVGSGIDIDNAIDLLKVADGAIVGTSIKTEGYVDYKKAKALVQKVHEAYS
jgi:hypothetical protein